MRVTCNLHEFNLVEKIARCLGRIMTERRKICKVKLGLFLEEVVCGREE